MEAVQVLSEYETQRGKPMPSINHALAQYRVIKAWSSFDDEFMILPELSLGFGEQPLVPDLSVYPRDELLAKSPVDWQHDKPKMVEPPWTVVEILSPTQSLDSLVRKAEQYLELGVKSVWIVQPVVEAVAILEAGKKPRTYTSGEVRDPATGLILQIEEIFQPVG